MFGRYLILSYIDAGTGSLIIQISDWFLCRGCSGSQVDLEQIEELGET